MYGEYSMYKTFSLSLRRPGQGRKVIDENLDKDLVDWVKEQWKQGVNVTVNMIRERAIESSRIHGFKASLGWYMKWQKRHGVDLKERTCNPPASEAVSPLKLRLLQEGEVFSYSPSPPARKRRKTNKARLSYDDEALLENDEEFDRQLLTWLVERWEGGDIVTDKMVKDRAMELTSNPDFKSTKPWLMAWKRKYNISLENQVQCLYCKKVILLFVLTALSHQTCIGVCVCVCACVWCVCVCMRARVCVALSTIIVSILQSVCMVYSVPALFPQTYGNEGDDEAEEIIEASEVYDQQVLLEDQQGPSTSGQPHSENPLTPTKEEAATALASLSAEDHEATGIEIAEALQKLANAFGITSQDGAKEAMAQLTAAYQGGNPEFLLEGGGQVAVEEVISEEVVTDEPMVVIEEGTIATSDTIVSEITEISTAPVISVSTSSTSGDNIVIETHTAPIVSTEVIDTSEPIQVTSEQIQVSSDQLQVTDENVVVSTSPSAQAFVSEEVIISEPVIETSEASGEVEVLVEGEGAGIVIVPTSQVCV